MDAPGFNEKLVSQVSLLKDHPGWERALKPWIMEWIENLHQEQQSMVVDPVSIAEHNRRVGMIEVLEKIYYLNEEVHAYMVKQMGPSS